MSPEIESLSTDLKARRPGQGVSPMLVALVVLGFLLAIYAHWRFGQVDDRLDRLRGQVAELRGVQERLDSRAQAVAAELESSRANIDIGQAPGGDPRRRANGKGRFACSVQQPEGLLNAAHEPGTVWAAIPSLGGQGA